MFHRQRAPEHFSPVSPPLLFIDSLHKHLPVANWINIYRTNTRLFLKFASVFLCADAADVSAGRPSVSWSEEQICSSSQGFPTPQNNLQNNVTWRRGENITWMFWFCFSFPNTSGYKTLLIYQHANNHRLMSRASAPAGITLPSRAPPTNTSYFDY